MPGNDAVLFFSETRVVEVKEIIMSAVFSADAAGALRWAFCGLRLGNTGAFKNTQVWVCGSKEHQHHLSTGCLHSWSLWLAVLPPASVSVLIFFFFKSQTASSPRVGVKEA